jgi:hypothetical protein
LSVEGRTGKDALNDICTVKTIHAICSNDTGLMIADFKAAFEIRWHIDTTEVLLFF